MAKQTDIKKLADRMMAGDVNGCYETISHWFGKGLHQWRMCNFCETWCDAIECRAPGCTAIGCPECLAFHSLAHLEDDPKDQRPI